MKPTNWLANGPGLNRIECFHIQTVNTPLSRTRSLHASDERISSSQSGRASRARSLQFEFDHVSTRSAHDVAGATTSSSEEDHDVSRGRKKCSSTPDVIPKGIRSPSYSRSSSRMEDVETIEDEEDDELDGADVDSNDDASSTDTFLNGITSLSIRERRRTGSRANSGSDTLSVHTLVACEDAALEDFKNAFRKPMTDGQSKSGGGGDSDCSKETLLGTKSEDEERMEEGKGKDKRLSSSAPPTRSASLPTLLVRIKGRERDKGRQGHTHTHTHIHTYTYSLVI